MKKFNLLMMATLVAFGSLFTSCTSDESADAPFIEEFTADVTSLPSTGGSVTLTIKVRPGTEKTEKIVIMRGDNIASDASGNIWNGVDVAGSKGYIGSSDITTKTATFNCTSTTTFTVTAYDKNELASETKSIIITVDGSSATLFSDAAVSTLSTAKDIICLQGDGGTNSAFSVNAANNSLMSTYTAQPSISNVVDFVYWNNSGNSESYSIYAPSAIPTFTSTWTTKNATKFATSTLNFDSATETEVTTAANAATATKVSDLAVGSVVVFKTASTSTAVSKIGMFKVTAITAGFASTDKITISVRVAK